MHRLHESEERYRTTFAQAAIGILHTSMDGKFLRCNPRFAEIIGYAPEEVPGLTIKQITPPDDMVISMDVLGRLCETGSGVMGLEKRYVRKDGTLTWVRLTSSAQRSDAE